MPRPPVDIRPTFFPMHPTQSNMPQFLCHSRPPGCHTLSLYEGPHPLQHPSLLSTCLFITRHFQAPRPHPPAAAHRLPTAGFVCVTDPPKSSTRSAKQPACRPAGVPQPLAHSPSIAFARTTEPTLLWLAYYYGDPRCMCTADTYLPPCKKNPFHSSSTQRIHLPTSCLPDP